MTTCRVCGERENIKVKFRKNSLNILYCQRCRLSYLDYDPKLESIKKFYSEEYFQGEGKRWGYYNYFAERENLLLSSQKRLTDIEKIAKVGRILDVGCATGFFLEAAKESGWKPYGVEVSNFAGSVARKKFGKNVTIGELQKNTFHKNYFDAVTLWDTIEHLPDPKETLKIIQGILKRGGLICLSTGDIESLLAKISGKSWHLYHLPEHLSFFSPKTIRNLLKSCGFRVISISHPGSYYTIEYLIRRLASSYHGKPLKILERIITNVSLRKMSLYVNLFDIMTVYAKKDKS